MPMNDIKTLRQHWLMPLKRLNRFRLWLWETPPVYEIRGRCFQLKERLCGYPELHRAFRARTGYALNLRYPTTFHHKITVLKISQSPKIFVRAVDKIFAKELAQEWSHQLGFRLEVARTLDVTKDVSTICWQDLPQRFLIKATHRSGANLFVDQSQEIDIEDLRLQTRSWLQYPYGVYKHEWAYWPVPRRLLIEELIEPLDGEELVDYKFHMSRGRCLMIQVNQGFHSGERTIAILDSSWQLQPVRWAYPRPEVTPQRPTTLDEMLEMAAAFSRDFPYLRVDLYSVKKVISGKVLSRVMFGEFTFFPGSGSESVDPFAFDLSVGQEIRL